MTDRSVPLLESLQRSQLMRVLSIALLVLLLGVPISLVRGVIAERERTREAAIAEVTATWGASQLLLGPRLAVPYRYRFGARDAEGVPRERVGVRTALFLPERLEIDGRVDSESRYRGIFEVPVYELDLEIGGHFGVPDWSDFGVDPADVLWERAHVTVSVSDPRAIAAPPTLVWGGSDVPFEPGAGDGMGTQIGIHAPVGRAPGADGVAFSFPLVLRGSVGAWFAPLGKTTEVELASDWPDPSFQGAWLPAEREVGVDGFRARWSIPYLGRGYPQRFARASAHAETVSTSSFGVELRAPVDHYRMALRSAKYGWLFLALTFGTLWLFEVLAGVRVHAIQYLLVGAAMCLFYLLEVSLAEHIGFRLAYALATSGVVLLVFGYCSAVLGGSGRAAVVGGVLASLYGYLFVLLRNQDYALLVGSVGLFVVLALVMYLTRAVDWFALGRALGEPPPDAPGSSPGA